MEKASVIDLDLIVKNIIDNELGIMLLEADTKSLFDVLVNETSYQDRQKLYGNNCHITYHLYPIMYKSKLNRDIDLTRCRHNAIYNIFKRWSERGYNKRNAKNPYSSKAFMSYLEAIEFVKADYMLLMVE